MLIHECIYSINYYLCLIPYYKKIKCFIQHELKRFFNFTTQNLKNCGVYVFVVFLDLCISVLPII